MTEKIVKKDGFPSINENCVYCGLCAKKCPKNAISVDRKTKHWDVDKTKCVMCAACAAVCRKDAVHLDHDARFAALEAATPPVSVPLSKGVLVCDESLCAGCMNCMFACTLNKEGAASLNLARIQMNVHTQAAFHIAAQPCLQCVDPQCLRFCPVGAITVDEKTGARVIQDQLCIGCRTCIDACPYDIPRIRFDSVRKKATKCDLCGGDPACVKMCPSGALKYVTDPDGIRTGYTQQGGNR